MYFKPPSNLRDSFYALLRSKFALLLNNQLCVPIIGGHESLIY